MTQKSSKTTDFFRRVGDAVLGVGELPNRLRQRIGKKAKKPEIPHALQGFFEHRHAGWPEYVMLKVQLAVLTLFVAEVIYLVFLRTETLIFIPLMLAFSIYLAYLGATELKLAFAQDYSAYRSFVVMCIAIAWVFVIALQYSPAGLSLGSIYAALIPPILAIVFVAAAFMAFRFKYGRNFTYGRVEEVQERRAVVKVGYDIRSNVKAGLYTVESFVKVKRGDQVKLGVDRPMLGLRGSKVRTILGKR
jgi:uncharacterized membrane protein